MVSALILAAIIGAAVLVAYGARSEGPRTVGARGAAPAEPESVAPRATELADIATPEELQLWSYRGCITCHGADARGTPMGPDLLGVLPLYVAKFGAGEAARAQLVAYMFDPNDSPKLRTDGEEYQIPMPSIAQFGGGTREEAATLAGLLLRLVR